MADKGLCDVTVTVNNSSDVLILSKVLTTYTDAATDEYVLGQVMTAETAGAVNIDLDTLAGTFICLCIQNLETVNALTVTWDDSGANSNTQLVPAGSILVIPDCDPATDPTVQMAVANGLISVSYFGT